MMGRPPDTERYMRVLNWVEAGKTHAWIGQQLGLTWRSARALVERARRWRDRERAKDEAAPMRFAVATALSQDHVLERIDEIITDGLKIQAQVIRPILEDLRRDLPELKRAIGVLLERMIIMEAAIERIERTPTSPATPIEPEGKSPKGTPPASLWVWLVQECCRELGRQGTADQIGVEAAVIDSWLRGRVPSAKYRDKLRTLAATLWARELFSDEEELLDARDRLPTLQAGYA